MPADQRREHGLAILRLSRNDFNAGEADLAAVLKTECPRVDDGAYDAFTLDASAKQTLQANGEILKAHPTVKVQIEGHCDQRGGIQYNIALGEKRANSAKKYLIDQGIGEDRITTISFGKERPIDQGTTEDAYAKNRRANFVITSK